MSGATRFAWRCWMPIAARAARAYIAGPTLGDALGAAEAAAKRGSAVSICPWDCEADSPRSVADAYLAALRGIAACALHCSLSIKAPSLRYSRDLLDEVLDTARAHGTALHFDSLAPETIDPTWPLIQYAAERHAPIGCTLPARWPRSADDAERAIALGVNVRVVKGQWADPAHDASDLRQRYLVLVERLAGRARSVGVATHDPPLAHDALTCLKRAGTRCELELLFGLPMRSQMEIAGALAVPVRLYIPYGHAWLPYGLSQVRQNPRILWWTARDWLLGGAAFRGRES